MTMTPAALIEKYIALRNKKADIEKRHSAELLPYNEVMGRIENELLLHLQSTKLDSVAGPSGTAYKQLNTSVTVDDWARTLPYIKDNDLWDLLEARVAKRATLETIEETKKMIPGVRISQVQVLRVRAG